MSGSLYDEEDEFWSQEGRDGSGEPLSKGGQFIPQQLTGVFLSWVNRHYRHIGQLKDLDYNSLLNLVSTYIEVTGQDSYSVEQWIRSIRQYL
jgi:hypothetical protein